MSTRALDITDEMNAVAESIAAEYDVSADLHEKDHILGFLQKTVYNDPVASVREYFAGGRRDASIVLSLVQNLAWPSPPRVLEFASGYGRLTRHFGGLDLTACDIHPEAVQFIRNTLGAPAIDSANSPEEWRPAQKYDFIFAVSLWSHLPDHLFGRWLTAVTAALAPGGYFMFTTHGSTTMRNAGSAYDDALDPATGFAYLNQSDQEDLGFDVYGTTISLPQYVIDRIYRFTTARIVSFSPAAWWGHQDQWIIRV